MNRTTNFLLFLIIVILLFGAGGVLGFLKSLFGIIAISMIFFGLIFLLVQGISEEQEKDLEFKRIKRKLEEDDPNTQIVRFGGLGLGIKRINHNSDEGVDQA